MRHTLDSPLATWDAEPVTPETEKLLQEFDALPEPDRSELVAELARRVALASQDGPRDEDLVAAAHRLLVELDRREEAA
jgi:hypothetical protein